MSQPFPSPATLPDLIARRAHQAPDTPAILAPACTPLTYAHLYAQCAAIVHKLRLLGIQRRDRIALSLPNGPEAAAAFLAVATCAAAAPLNPAYTAAELNFYLGDLRARAVLALATSDTPIRAVAAARGIPVLDIVPRAHGPAGSFALAEVDAAPMPESPTAPPDAALDAAPDDVALVLHTSGTTARPKIVPLAHANLTASACNIAEALALTSSDRCLNVMPLFHIHGLVAAVLAGLAAGASVVCTPGLDADAFYVWIEQFQPTWYTAVPTMHQAILARAAAHPHEVAASRLRFIRSCSAPLPPTVMRDLERTFGVPVVEAYGMTEAAHQISCNPLPPARRVPGSVGLPTGVRVAILDDAGAPLPPGASGEIALSGPSVVAGYEGGAAVNMCAFTNGWFRTGDQGHLDEDGYLYLTGRLKELINRGGEKIAPREVDEALLAHPAVARAVAFALPHPTLGEDVAAAVVARPSSVLTELELRRFVAERLAPFKVPRRIVLVDAIPTGPTGKPQRVGLAERLGLAAAVLTGASAPAPYEAPQTPLETALAGVWASVLGIARVGRAASFLALGGDSLQATLVASRIRATLQVDVPLDAFFEAPSLADFAILVEGLLLDALERIDERNAAGIRE